MFLTYAKSLGKLMSLLMLVFFVLYQLASVASSIWLSKWTEDDILKNSSLVNTTTYRQRQNLFLGIYGGLSGLQGEAFNLKITLTDHIATTSRIERSG